jgi:hypothetical protein
LAALATLLAALPGLLLLLAGLLLAAAALLLATLAGLLVLLARILVLLARILVGICHGMHSTWLDLAPSATTRGELKGSPQLQRNPAFRRYNLSEIKLNLTRQTRL